MAMQTKQPDITRNKILISAFCEIHRHGFQAASIAKILDETSLTKGALYHHFPNKQALGLAVIEEVIKQQFEVQLFKPLRESKHPVDMLLEIISIINMRIPADFILLGCPLNNLMQEMSALDETFQKKLSNVLEIWKSTIEDVLLRGKKTGEIRSNVDHKSVSLFIVSAWEGCSGVAKNMQSPKSFETCMMQLHAYIQSLKSVKSANVTNKRKRS